MLGFNHALRGLFNIIKSERNFKIQFSIFLVVLCMGFYFKIETLEWLIIILTSGAILSLEIINSAIEKTCDLISRANHPEIKVIKDISAGAVLLLSIFAVVVGLIIFIPHWLAY
ncbi:diacylglycerol kinase [Brumimicrobium salinarum]|uniref:Diacylglycerol kinase n=1 Tax=Brumimicrobium salinarum TaxID=2058658 RepID=A0A2I0QZW1_9FLAO|nr:diacylglycerol kinase family protein [Brumimicrobium salinarum]PKR79849.1 diacylglycerol kinase [Brumimicrobium salinarum]